MGLLDVLNGIQNGPHGQRVPTGSGGTNTGGMSPITMAILGLLAYKAIKGFSGQPTTAPTGLPGGGNMGGGTIGAGMPGTAAGGGLLGGLLKGGLGNLLAGGAGGAAAGSILSGGLGDLLKQFQQSGQGATANSWVGNGPNQPVSPNDLANALGADQINSLMQHTGMSRDDLLAGLSQHLPDVVNQLTPDGRVPTEQEASRLL